MINNNVDSTVCFFKDLHKTLSAMSDRDAGILMKALFAHANGEEAIGLNKAPIAAALYIGQADQMDRLNEYRRKKASGNKSKKEQSDPEPEQSGSKTEQTETKAEQNATETEQSGANGSKREQNGANGSKTEQTVHPYPYQTQYPSQYPDQSQVDKPPSVAERKAPTGPKENHVKAEVVAPLPPEIDSPQTAIEWENFVKLRKEKRKPLTERARSMIMKDLVKFARGDPERAVKILQQSIRKGWTDIYDLKDNANFAKSINWEAV